MREIEIIKNLRRWPYGLSLLKCKEIALEAEGDLEKALWIADGRPEPDEISELERLQNLPNESKIETEDHLDSVKCPYCDQEFFTKGGGAYAG